MIAFKRHDLMFFNCNAIGKIRETAKCTLPNAPHACMEELLCLVGNKIPGIVRRQEEGMPVDLVSLGFSSPHRVDGVRYRVAADIPLLAVERILTPYDILELASRISPDDIVLRELYELGHRCGVTVGLMGSRALQLVTGLDYSPDDYDLILEGNIAHLRIYAEQVRHLERDCKVVVDMEVRVLHCGTEYDVKLKELLSKASWVMGKSLTSVTLLRPQELSHCTSCDL